MDCHSAPQESIQWPNVLDPMKRQADLSRETGDGETWRQNFRGKRDSPADLRIFSWLGLNKLKLLLQAHPLALAGRESRWHHETLGN